MLLKKLAEIESPSGKEKELKEFVRNYLEEHGYAVVENELFLLANRKSDLLVSTHLDTVKTKAKFRIEGNYAFGTGVADAKASLAAILEAARKGVDYSLAFFCEEEETGRGSKAFLDYWDGKYAIVMEPTNLKIASKHLGCIEADLVFRGIPCHASMPEFGVNAIEKALLAYLNLSKKFKVSILRIDGGSYEYVIPDKCSARFDFLLEPGELQIAMEELKNLDAEINIIEAVDGFYSKKSAEILARAMELSGITPEYTTMPSWTDACNLAKKFDVVVWGPGELRYCHTEWEKIDLKQIETAVKVLQRLNDVLQ
uniref:M20/M25/M40 family metallo-hydrolase n=1 Tax=Archaeoglobus fulgidus TaxID=2234 RepID=A0A7J2TK13_ARCFL